MATGRDIVSTRLLTASRETAFAAFSDPARLASWWGPRDFTNEFHRFDFNSGGSWEFTMRAPDGTAYAMDHRFVEIVAPERILVRHIQPGHDFTLTVSFAAQGDRTEVTWRMVFDDPTEAERVRAFVTPANEQNLDRLEAHLAQAVSGSG